MRRFGTTLLLGNNLEGAHVEETPNEDHGIDVFPESILCLEAVEADGLLRLHQLLQDRLVLNRDGEGIALGIKYPSINGHVHCPRVANRGHNHNLSLVEVNILLLFSLILVHILVHVGLVTRPLKERQMKLVLELDRVRLLGESRGLDIENSSSPNGGSRVAMNSEIRFSAKGSGSVSFLITSASFTNTSAYSA